MDIQSRLAEMRRASPGKFLVAEVDTSEDNFSAFKNDCTYEEAVALARDCAANDRRYLYCVYNDESKCVYQITQEQLETKAA